MVGKRKHEFASCFVKHFAKSGISKALSQTTYTFPPMKSKDFSKFIGSTLKFDYKVDKELIGGLKLQLGSFMIDTSIKNELKKYEQAMIEN